MSLSSTFLKIALPIAVIAGFTNPLWTDVEGATKVVRHYPDITSAKIGGYGWFKCGHGDLWSTNFTGKDARGQDVSGTVCKGLFKGSTLRFD